MFSGLSYSVKLTVDYQMSTENISHGFIPLFFQQQQQQQYILLP